MAGFTIGVYAAALAAGIYLSDMLPVFFTVLFLIIYVIFSLIFFHEKYKYIVATAIFCLGVIITHAACDSSRSALAPFTDKYVTAVGRVSSIPKRSGDNFSYILKVDKIHSESIQGTECKEPGESLLVSSTAEYKPGDTIKICGFISPVSERLNSTGFDFVKYYASRGIFFKCHASVSELSEERIRDFSVSAIALSFKALLAAQVDKYTSGDTNLLLKAILIGEFSEFSEEYDAAVNRSGIYRFFYPTFLHIFLIIGTIGFLRPYIKRDTADIISAVLILLYAAAESSHPIVLKSALLIAVAALSKRLLHFSHFPDVVSAMIIILGIVNPLLLFNSGIVVGTAACIAIQSFTAHTGRFLREHLPPKFDGTVIFSSRFAKSLFLQILCTLVLLPLTAFFYNGISPYAILLSPILIPVTAAILILSPILFIFLNIFGCGLGFTQILTFLLWLYRCLPHLIAALPFSFVCLGRPSLPFLVGFYIIMYSLFRFLQKTPNAVTRLTAAGGAAAIAFSVSAELARMGTAEFHFVNVGQGDGAYIELPHRDAILIDGGGSNGYNDNYNAGKTEYVPYLLSHGITHASIAIVSHPHSDHIRGITEAVKSIDVDTVYLGDGANEYTRELYTAANKYGTKICRIEEDTVLSVGNALQIEITVSRAKTENENDASLLVRTGYRSISCLFTGDITEAAETAFVRSGARLDSDILKVAHHGSRASSSAIFTEAVSPEYSVIGVGEDNAYNHPSPEALARLSGSEILRTDRDGDITFIADRSGIRKVETFKSERER